MTVDVVYVIPIGKEQKNGQRKLEITSKKYESNRITDPNSYPQLS